MKRIFNLTIAALSVMIIATSCADDSLSPIVTFDKLGKGGYPRLVQQLSGEFDLQDISGSSFDYEIELVDINQGKDVTSYEIWVGFNGGDYVLHQAYTQADFTDSPRGFRGLSISIPFTAAAATVSEDPNTMVPGDYFVFDTRVTVGGIVFTFDNASPAVNGSAFAGFFRPRVNVTCPLPDTDFAGDYTLTGVSAYQGGFGDFFTADGGITVTLELVPGSTTRRTFDFDYNGFGIGGTWELDFLCDAVLSASFNLGASCGAGDISASGVNGAFNINDDTSFTFSLTETDDGACGFAQLGQIDMMMTKN